uniref:Uncharacterized protein n=1 Tax=Ditylenchus dipsaci TaxID=166011 RepID=A0A915DCD1_9BILA
MIFGGQTTTTTLSIIFGIGLALVSGSNSQDLQLHNTFSPKVEWSCWRKQLHVSITSNTPFHGLATTTKANSSRSSMPSNAPSKAMLNKEEGRISVQLEVHEHPFILMSHDHFYNISCQLTEESDMTTTLPPTTKSLLEADGLLVVQQQAAPQAVTR